MIGSTLDCLACGLVLDLAFVGETGLCEDLIAPVDGELALLDGGLQEVEQVAGVHLTRVIGELAGEPDGADDLDALMRHHLAGAGELAVAALLRGDVDDHRPRAHALHDAALDDLRCGAPRNGRRRHYGIRSGDAGVEDLLLLALLLFGELTRVATGSFRAHSGLDELRAERLHLLTRCATNVIRFHNRPKTSRRRDRL